MRSNLGYGLLLLAVAAAGCAAPSGGDGAGAKAPTTAVATTRLSAAELEESEDAPRVGKAQRSAVVSESVEEEAPAKGAASSTRHVERRPGGGFSGYK